MNKSSGKNLTFAGCVVAFIVGAPYRLIADEPLRVERTLTLKHQPISSLELNEARTAVVAVNTHGDIGVIRDFEKAEGFQATHLKGAQQAVISADDKYIFVGGAGSITVLDAVTLREQSTIELPSEKSCVRLLTAGRILLAVGLEQEGNLFHIGDTGKLVLVATVKDVLATSDGSSSLPLWILLKNGILHSYHPKSLKLSSRATYVGKFSPNFARDKISSDGETLYVEGKSGLERISLSAREPTREKFDVTLRYFNAFDFAGDSGLVLACRATIAYVDSRTLKTLARFELDDVAYKVRALAQKGRFIAVLNDCSVILFSIPLPK